MSQFNIAENVADLYKEKQVEKEDENIIQKKTSPQAKRHELLLHVTF